MDILKNTGFKPWKSDQAFISIAGINLLLMVFCSYKLWSGIERSFYKVPILPFEIPQTIDFILLIAFTFFLLGLILSSEKQKWILISSLILAFFILTDIHRLQIWVYQSLLILIAPLLVSKKHQRIQLFIIIIGGTYLWAGLHKINFAFYDAVYPWFMNTYEFTEALSDIKYLSAIPIITEITLGILILTRKRLKYAFYLSILFHTSILFFLGPWGSGWNFIVYPWNILSPVMVWCLYRAYKQQTSTFQFFPALGAYTLVCLILPALYIFNLYPMNLSFALYTGRSDYAYFTKYNANGKRLNQENIGQWANTDLHIPSFKSDWVHEYMAKKHIEVKNDRFQRGLMIVKYKNPVFSREKEVFEEILNK